MIVWEVQHEEHGTVKVEADTRLDAVATAARLWGVPWTSIARACNAVAKAEIKNPPEKKARKRKKKEERPGGN